MTFATLRAAFITIFSAVFLSVTSPLTAQEKTAIRDGFSLEAQSGKTILVFRPSVSVGAQSTGGMFEPNAEWTEQAKANIEESLAEFQARLGNKVITAPDVSGAELRNLQQHMFLFAAVADAVIEYQFFVGNRLPTKKRENKKGVFDWSLGPTVADLPGAAEADYGLFIYNKDMYGSTGRKALQIVGMFAGIGVSSGEHRGYAGLVDLKSGDILWLNADGQMGGDVRKVEGSKKRVRQLLEEFPGSEIGDD